VTKSLKATRLAIWVALLARAVAVVAATVCVAWLIGRIVSDRFGWSQWLLWIPTPAVLMAVAVALAVGCRRDDVPGRRRRRLIAWGVTGGAVLGFFTFIEHRFGRPAPGGDATLRLVHASVQATGPRVLDAYGEGLAALDGDVTIVSSLFPVRNIDRLIDRLDGLGEPVTVWPFVMFTKLPVVEARPLVANADLRVGVYRVDATATVGHVVTIWVVDLPSDPRRRRHLIATRARSILDMVTSDPPDLVVGDFNMTRGSASLARVFPDLSHAFDEAGRGYGASFRRGLPLYHIDHTLLADTVHAVNYDLVDIGVGRHLVQVIDLR
jgi:hypothetical protein